MNWYNYFPHLNKTLNNIFNHSFRVKEHEKLLIEFIDVPVEVIKFVLSQCIEKKIQVFYFVKYQDFINQAAKGYNEEFYSNMAKNELAWFKEADYFLGIRAYHNSFDFSDIAFEDKQKILKTYIKPVHYEYRNQHIPWLYFRLPTKAMAQQAGMPTNAFLDYYFKTLNFDYTTYEKQLLPAKEWLMKTNKVRIESPDTNIRFSIKDMPAFIDAGQLNLPDGEVRSVPVKNSLTGNIGFNIPSTYYGVHFNKIYLNFENGKIISAHADKNESKLQEILSVDEGSKYTGEFAIGVNPYIHSPINDILFDEKIFGSIHLAIGNAHPSCDNGNRSVIHWDLILNLNENYGGGKIWFDDELIMRDGRFVPHSLLHLNPKD